MEAFTLIAAVVAAVGLVVIVAKLSARRFNRQLGLPLTFEPCGDGRLRLDRIRLKANCNGDLTLSYRVTNMTRNIIRKDRALGDFFTLRILGDRLQETLPLPRNVCLLPGESRDCDQRFLLSSWRKDCGIPLRKPLPDMCTPNRWTLTCDTTGKPLAATTTYPEGA